MAFSSTVQRGRKTAVFLTVAVLANSFGNLLLSIGMNQLPAFGQVSLAHYILALIQNPFLISGAALTATYTAAQMSLFSWADLSFVIPCIASSYAASTLLAQFLLGERVLFLRWAGVLLILLGVSLVASTPQTTKQGLGGKGSG